MSAARLDRPDAASVAAELGCSSPTARRVAALMGGLGLARPATPEAKLQMLLAASPPPPRRSGRRWPAPAEPQRLIERQVGSLTRSERLVSDALRRRVFGATVHTIADLSGVSTGHVRRCLRRVERLGWPVCESRSRLWGYRQLRVWRLTWSGSCAEMLAHLPAEPAQEPPRGFDDMVPPEFWFDFWSGTPADKLRVSTDGLLIAETLITGHNPAARLWALAEMPVDILARCRQLPGM